jgi:hypothetical protein
MNAQLAAWILRMMLILQPASVTPWADSYGTTAAVFADVAIHAPLFPGKDGIERTAALFTSVAWYEGRFDPQAKGDGKCLEYVPVTEAELKIAINGPPGTPMRPKMKCLKKGPPQSVCMFQIGISNLAGLRTTQEELLSDTTKCTLAARTMMQTSFGVCHGLPISDLLGHYASGGNTCGGIRESRHRMNTAQWVFDRRGK